MTRITSGRDSHHNSLAFVAREAVRSPIRPDLSILTAANRSRLAGGQSTRFSRAVRRFFGVLYSQATAPLKSVLLTPVERELPPAHFVCFNRNAFRASTWRVAK